MATKPSIPFEFKPVQFTSDMTAAERENERKIKTLLMVNQEDPSCYVCKSLTELVLLLKQTQQSIDGLHPQNLIRVSLYQIHEEIEVALDLVKKRTLYAHKLKSGFRKT